MPHDSCPHQMCCCSSSGVGKSGGSLSIRLKVKRNGKQYSSMETICYHSEPAEGFVTPAVFQLVLCTTVPVIKKLFEWFHKMYASAELADNLRKLSRMDRIQIQSDQPTADVVSESASHLAEVIRSVCLFHNHTEIIACLIGKKAMFHEFPSRINNDGVLTKKGMT